MKGSKQLKFKTFTSLLLSLFIIGPLLLFAQDKPLYVLVTKIKTDRNKSGDYLELINNYGSKVWKDRVKSGEILWVGMYSVGMTSEPVDYNFVSLTGANSVAALMEPASSPKDILKKMMPDATEKMIQEALDKYGQVRTMQGQLIIKLVDGFDGGTPPKQYEVDFMKATPGREAEYVNLERTVYKPLHQERMKNDEITTWGLWQVVYPGSDKMEYDYVTNNGIANWDKFMSTDYSALYKKVFPKGDLAKTMAQTGATRTMVRSETWKLELLVDGK